MPGEYGTSALLVPLSWDADIQALDDLTLQIVTPEPLADLLDLLLYAVIVPARYIESGHKTRPRNRAIPGVDEKENEVVLQRFAAILGGPSPVKELVFRAIKTPEQRVQAFLDGEVDLITYMPVRYERRICRRSFGSPYRTGYRFLCHRPVQRPAGRLPGPHGCARR